MLPEIQPTVGKRKKRRMIQQQLKDAEGARAKAAHGTTLAYIKDPIEQRVADLMRQLIDLIPMKLQVTQAQEVVEAVAEEAKTAQEALDAAERKQEPKRYMLQVLLVRHAWHHKHVCREESL